jgi:TolB protein
VFTDRPVFTPDGKGIVHESNRGGAANLWMQPLNGDSPVRLTSGPGPDESPTVSRDGTIAFINARSHRVLFTHDLDTGRNRELSRHTAILWAPRFSRDGRQLTYSQSEPDGAWHIWRTPAEGGAAHRVTNGPVPEVYSCFTPDGTGIVFSSWSSGPDRVWLAPLGGGPTRALTPRRDEDDAYADVSPDGRSIAFARTEGALTRIYIAPMDGGPARPLLDTESTVPRWSPDGKWIAFSVSRTFLAGIFIINSDGTGLRRLTPTGSWPVWFPDGSRIAYLSQAADGNQEVLTVPFQGGPPQPIRSLRYSGANYPIDIAPDGKSLATTNTVHFASEIWKLEPTR